MERLDSSLKNMVLSLTIITMAAAAGLGAVYELTKSTIEQTKAAKQANAISAVLPKHARVDEPKQINGMLVYKAYDENDQLVGAAIETSTGGYGGQIKIMVGFDTNNQIVDYSILEHAETPGLGANAPVWFRTNKGNQNVIGRTIDDTFYVTQDGGTVDAITAATITSRAFINGIRAAFEVYQNEENADAQSGASMVHPKDNTDYVTE